MFEAGATERVCPGHRGLSAAGFFDVLEAGGEDLLDAVQLGPPEVAHVVEALVNAVKLGIDAVKLGVDAVKLGVDGIKLGVKPSVGLAPYFETNG